MSQASAAYARRRRQEVAHGTWLKPVPLEDIQPHLIDLVERHKMTQASIGRASGVDRLTVRRIMQGERKWVQGQVAAHLFAVEPTPTPPRDDVVDVIGARRMSRALAVIGYGLEWQAGQTGLGIVTLRQIRGDARSRRGKPQRWVHVDSDAAISAMYDRAPLRSPEQNSRAVIWAKRKGWHGPLAWDDDTIRDPRARPYVEASRRTHVLDSNIDDAIAGRIGYDALTTAERVIVVARLSSLGWSAERIGDWLTWGDTDYHCRVNVTKFMERHEIQSAPRAAFLSAMENLRQVKRYTERAA